MKTIQLLPLLYTALTIGLVVLIALLQDPLVRKSEFLRLHLELMQSENASTYVMNHCRQMLSEAEHCLHRAENCRETMRRLRAMPYPPSRHDSDLSRMNQDYRRLRSRADDLMDEVRFMLELEHRPL